MIRRANTFAEQKALLESLPPAPFYFLRIHRHRRIDVYYGQLVRVCERGTTSFGVFLDNEYWSGFPLDSSHCLVVATDPEDIRTSVLLDKLSSTSNHKRLLNCSQRVKDKIANQSSNQ